MFTDLPESPAWLGSPVIKQNDPESSVRHELQIFRNKRKHYGLEAHGEGSAWLGLDIQQDKERRKSTPHPTPALPHTLCGRALSTQNLEAEIKS